MAVGGATTSNRVGASRRQEDAPPSKSATQTVLCSRLSHKIRKQATHLAHINERLQHEEAYSKLLERRLLELDPEHPLPVTPQHLDCCGGAGATARNDGRGGGLSRLHQQQQRSSHPGAVGRRKEDGDDSSSMLQGYEAAQERLKDAAQLIRTLREALASRYGAARKRETAAVQQLQAPAQ